MPYKNKEDQRAAVRKHYNANKQYYVDKRQKLQDELQAIINERKSIPCTDCGVKYPPYVMQFDHLGDKEYTIARMSRLGSRRKLLLEMDKCEVVCANCHAERTNSRRHAA